jgi:hypothetical protein
MTLDSGNTTQHINFPIRYFVSDVGVEYRGMSTVRTKSWNIEENAKGFISLER